MKCFAIRFHYIEFHFPQYIQYVMSSRAALFKKSASRNHEFERYLILSEPSPVPDIMLDSTANYVITLPLSYFVSSTNAATTAIATTTTCRRPKGKADTMPYESFRIINAQHRGGQAHSLVLIKSRAIQTNPHHIAIFESNGCKRYCSIRIIDESMKNVTRDYTTISPEYNINYGSGAYNPGYCGIYSLICVVAFRHYRSKTGTLWLTKWKKLLAHMSQRINSNVGTMGVELAAKVQEIIATTPSNSSAEKEIAASIRSFISSNNKKQDFISSLNILNREKI